MKKTVLITFFGLIATTALLSQQNVGIGTSTPSANAILEVASTTKGVLLPRMNFFNRLNYGSTLGNSDAGMIVYDINFNEYHYWDGTQWKLITTGAPTTAIWTNAPPDGAYYNGGSVSIGSSLMDPDLQLQIYSSSADTTEFGIYALNSSNTGTTAKTGIYGEADQNGTGHKFGTAGIARGHMGGQFARIEGLYGRAFAQGLQTATGTYSWAESAGSGQIYGTLSLAKGGGTGERYGVYGIANTPSSNSATYGGYFSAEGINAGKKTGLYAISSLEGNGIKYGIEAIVQANSAQTLPIYGAHISTLPNTAATGETYGLLSEILNNSAGPQYGVYSSAGSGSNNAWSFYGAQGNAYFSHDVRIGHTDDVVGHTFSVRGDIICENITTLPYGSWPDYVFEENYNLMPLEELQRHIRVHKHLPGIPSAQEIEEAGVVHLNQMNEKLLEKIEELTLHLIQLNERVKELEQSRN